MSTASSGFHAPTPGQGNVETISTTFLPGSTNNVQIGTFPVTSPVAQYYGAKAIRPEESTNLAGGVVLTLPEQTLVTVDVYSIVVRHRISLSEQFNVMQSDITKLPDLAAVGAGGQVQYFTNGFDTRTKGLDLVGTRSSDLLDGRLRRQVAYNENIMSVQTYDHSVIDSTASCKIKQDAPHSRPILNAVQRTGAC